VYSQALLLEQLYLLLDVDVALTMVAIACLGSRTSHSLLLRLFHILYVLYFLYVLLDVFAHVNEVELVDVGGVEGVLGLELLCVLQEDRLVVLAVSALATALALVLFGASRSKGTTATPFVALVVLATASCLQVVEVGTSLLDAAALLEPATADLHHRLRPLATICRVDGHIILREQLVILECIAVLLVRRRVKAVLLLQGRDQVLLGGVQIGRLLVILVHLVKASGCLDVGVRVRLTDEEVDALASQGVAGILVARLKLCRLGIGAFVAYFQLGLMA